MDKSEQIIAGLQDAREALTLVREFKQSLDKHTTDLKASVRNDLQSIFNHNLQNIRLETKLAVIDALKEHHKEEIKPLENRVDTIESEILSTKKAVKWAKAAVAFTLAVVGIKTGVNLDNIKGSIK